VVNVVDFETYIEDAIGDTVAFLPKLVGALIILLIGWLAGRMLGKYLSKVLDRVGVDDAIRKTSIGQNIEKSGLSLVRLFDLLIRWFVYLIALMGATNVLEIEFLSTFMDRLVSYIPNVAAFLIVLMGGFVLVDFFADFVHKFGSASEIGLMGPAVTLLRIFFSFVVVVLALTQLKIDLEIIYTFVKPVAWGVGIGVGAAIAIIFGFGLRDRSKEMVDTFLTKVKK
jgi:hypothetical protein